MIEKLRAAIEEVEGHWSMTALAPDDLRKIIHQLEQAEKMREALKAYIDAYDNATGTVYVEPQIRAALSQAKGDV